MASRGHSGPGRGGGTGSYGAGLAHYLIDADIEMVEVNRSNRQLRRQKDGTTVVAMENTTTLLNTECPMFTLISHNQLRKICYTFVKTNVAT